MSSQSTAYHYVLGDPIAKGGMAEVYRGLQVGADQFKRLVAIKRILNHYGGQQEFAEMFRDEAHIGQRLQHANIVRVECFAEVENAAAIVMEYVDGPDLRTFLAEVEKSAQRMPVPFILYIIAEAARGLHYAHSRTDEFTQKPLGIVHRDISPQNILVSYEGEVKVTDFGIAAAQQDFRQTETKAGVVKGKYSYMSPEQITSRGVDGRTDIFALAVVLWEMLAMRRLFSGESEVETIELVRNCRIPVRLLEINPDVDEELESIVIKGLSKDVKRRYQSAEQLEKELRRYLNKKFPSFNVAELADFLKTICAKRRAQSAEALRKLLSEKAAPASGPDKVREFSLDPQALSAKFTVARGSKSAPGFASNNPRSMSGVRGSGASKPLRSGTTNPQTFSGSGSHIFFKFFLAISLIAVAIFMAFPRLSLFTAKEAEQVMLQVKPSRVRVHVDGMKLGDGGYIRTPRRLALSAAPHQIRVSRPGYAPETVNMDLTATAGATIPLKIHLVPKVAFSPTMFVLQGNSTEIIHLDVNSGFATGELTAATGFRLLVEDLAEGIPTEITVRGKARSAPFACRFTPRGGSLKKPSLVSLDLIQKRCVVRNP